VNGTADKSDLARAIKYLREGRSAAQAAAAASKAKSRKEPVNVDKLFDDLDKI
jgi:hypothetical protein